MFLLFSALWSRFKKSLFKNVKKLPIIRSKIAAEVAKTASQVEAGFSKGIKGLHYVRKLPEKGLTEV